MKKEQNYLVTLHTDQGSVYSSAGFYQTHKNHTNIKRSMSRAGTPTDNPIIESLNGWIKEEMKIDFNLKKPRVYPRLLKTIFIILITKDYLTNSITKPLFNIELNKGLSNWWFLLSTFT